MQKLAKEGFISSYQGIHGGYTLVRDPRAMTVSSIIQAIEGRPSVTIIQCGVKGAEDCNIQSTCTIKDPLVKLQGTINQMFDEMTVMQLV